VLKSTSSYLAQDPLSQGFCSGCSIAALAAEQLNKIINKLMGSFCIFASSFNDL
jgi:hypothetical protein